MTLKTAAQYVALDKSGVQSNKKALSVKEKFNTEIVNKSALAISNIRSENFDVDKAKDESSDALLALGADNGLQTMLAAQMLSIHSLQQETMVFANAIDDAQTKQYYINSVVKLANCFTQQTALLAKLQGQLAQKITVERVDVHNGGQAVVGNVSGLNQTDKVER